jgi:hypothetical protein
MEALIRIINSSIVSFTIGGLMVGATVYVVKDQAKLVEKINNAVTVANSAKSATEQLDQKQVVAVVRVEVNDAIGKLKDNKLAQATNALVAVANTNASLAESSKVFQDITPETLAAIKTIKENEGSLAATAALVEKVAATDTIDYKLLVDTRLAEAQKKFDEQIAITLKQAQQSRDEITFLKDDLNAKIVAFNNLLAKTADKDALSFLSNTLFTTQSGLTTANATLVSHGNTLTLHTAQIAAVEAIPVGALLCFTSNTPPDATKWAYASDLEDKYMKPSATAGTVGTWKTGRPASLLFTTTSAGGSVQGSMDLQVAHDGTGGAFKAFGYGTRSDSTDNVMNLSMTRPGVTVHDNSWDTATDVDHLTVRCYRKL